jgi:hypothetical protein
MTQRITSFSWPPYDFPSDQATREFDQFAAWFRREFNLTDSEDDDIRVLVNGLPTYFYGATEYRQYLINEFHDTVARLGGVTRGAVQVSHASMPKSSVAPAMPTAPKAKVQKAPAPSNAGEQQRAAASREMLVEATKKAFGQ